MNNTCVMRLVASVDLSHYAKRITLNLLPYV